MKHFYWFLLAGLVISGCSENGGKPVVQKSIPRVDSMSAIPQPLHIINYEQLALQFDSTVYDFNAQGEFWPMVWIDSSGKNFKQNVVGLYTAIGDVRQGRNNNKGMFHEALATMGGVLGGTLVGINKANQNNLDYVDMLRNYFNRETGWNIMMNNTCPEVAMLGGGYGRDWWYDVYPNVLFYAIYDKYPHAPGFDTLARSIADKFYQADSVLNGNYNYSFFDYAKLTPVTSHICPQPDAAAGHAYVLYAAWKKFDDAKYLTAAKNALTALQSQPANPTYEVLMPFGAYMAARINAELGEKFDLEKMLEWSFDGTPKCREGWGVLVGNWNGMDISGIVGSTVDHGGYGFLMNTYDAAWPLVPLVRYDQRHANAIGKWMLHAANAAKLFYPDHMPAAHQTLYNRKEITKGVIGYEGIVQRSTFDRYANIKAPVAQGDGPNWVPGKNPDVSQFSVYGSAHVGIFGSIIQLTDVPGILQLNLLATDFFHAGAYPSYLYYNPYGVSKTVSITLEKGQPFDLYNTVTASFIKRNVSGSTELTLPAQTSAVIVCVPAGGKQTVDGTKMSIGGVVVDYHYQR